MSDYIKRILKGKADKALKYRILIFKPIEFDRFEDGYYQNEKKDVTNMAERKYHFERLTPIDDMDLDVYEEAINHAFDNSDITMQLQRSGNIKIYRNIVAAEHQ